MNDEPNELISDDELIQAIFDAATERGYVGREEADRKLSDAIDRAMSSAYADGRADERREWLHKYPSESAVETKARIHPVFEEILSQFGPRRAA